MNTPFDGQRGLIVVPVEIAGPTGIAIVRMALDTGATSTVVNAVLLATVGYDPTLAPNRVQVTTGSGIEFAPVSWRGRLQAWADRARTFPCWHTPCRPVRVWTASWDWTSYAITC